MHDDDDEDEDDDDDDDDGDGDDEDDDEDDEDDDDGWDDKLLNLRICDDYQAEGGHDDTAENVLPIADDRSPDDYADDE